MLLARGANNPFASEQAVGECRAAADLLAEGKTSRLGLSVAAAEAQTPFQPKGQVPATPPPKAGTASPQSAEPAKAVPAARVPVSTDMKQQAEFQAEGIFPDLVRPGGGGQMQDAWNESTPDQGVHVQRLCEDCVYKVRTREFMTTTIILPDDAQIASADPGDTVGFQVALKAKNKLAVRPTGWGMDTNINVYTKSGTVYPFYVRSERVNSMNVPDLVVKIQGRERPAGVAAFTEAIDDDKKAKPAPMPNAGRSKDFVRNVPIDPAKFHGWGDYKLWGDESLKPETVWRDDFFTYIRYGRKWDGMELASGFVTLDGIDELVNTRTEGTVFIVESTAPLITLKLGKKYLCIQYTGEVL